GISTQSRFSGRSPVTIMDPACSPPYVVDNFDGEQYGTITLDQATTNSVNTVYAQLITQIGPEKVAQTLAKFGFDRKGTDAQRKIAPYCSLALGSLDVTPVEMARAYSGFDAQGKLPAVTPIAYIKNSDGDCLKAFVPVKFDCKFVAKPPPDQVADANSTAVLSQTLTHVVQGGTATAADIGRPVAGKTGTTQNHQNAWFAGYIPQMTTVVWMGYPIQPGPDHKFGTPPKDTDDFIPQMQYCSDTALCRPVHGQTVVGGLFPAQIWAKYMTTVAASMPVLPFPLPTAQPTNVMNSAAPVAKPSRSAQPQTTAPPPHTTAPPPSQQPSPSHSPGPASSPPGPVPTATKNGEPP
ncbi:MAG: penicillin-binding transpeptidase domain-containing protein, partial [Actinomycetota bacterium]|nr:penicillin-binding transpeptidase domain-containing protein [Actinomycetota bacterium]